MCRRLQDDLPNYTLEHNEKKKSTKRIYQGTITNHCQKRKYVVGTKTFIQNGKNYVSGVRKFQNEKWKNGHECVLDN